MATKTITIQFEVENDLTVEELHQMLCVTIHEQGGPTEELEVTKMKVLDIIIV